jgi:hypothetical protein
MKKKGKIVSGCNCSEVCEEGREKCKLRVPLVLIAVERNATGLMEALYRNGLRFNMTAKGREPLVVEA